MFDSRGGHQNTEDGQQRCCLFFSSLLLHIVFIVGGFKYEVQHGFKTFNSVPLIIVPVIEGMMNLGFVVHADVLDDYMPMLSSIIANGVANSFLSTLQH